MTKCTLRGTRQKKLSNAGFRTRMKTPSGRRILKNRRNKERKFVTTV